MGNGSSESSGFSGAHSGCYNVGRCSGYTSSTINYMTTNPIYNVTGGVTIPTTSYNNTTTFGNPSYTISASINLCPVDDTANRTRLQKGR